jgi:hypothetical protein
VVLVSVVRTMGPKDLSLSLGILRKPFIDQLHM